MRYKDDGSKTDNEDDGGNFPMLGMRRKQPRTVFGARVGPRTGLSLTSMTRPWRKKLNKKQKS